MKAESNFQEIPDFDPKSIGSNIPYQRMDEPIDIARACAFMVSGEADYLVRHIMVVDSVTLSKLALPDHSKFLEDKE